MARKTNGRKLKGEIHDAVDGADVIVGVSGPGTLSKHHIEKMAPQAIVFALANPIPLVLYMAPSIPCSTAIPVITSLLSIITSVLSAIHIKGLWRNRLVLQHSHLD